MIEIPLPKDLPTGNSRLHWAAMYRVRKSMRQNARLIIRSAKLPKARGRRELTLILVRGKGQRLLDMDNAIIALKPIVDALVDMGVIVDDSEKWVTVFYHQIKGEQPTVKIDYKDLA